MGPDNRLALLVAWSVQLSSSLFMASLQVAAPPDGVEREARSMKYKEERPLANLDAAVKKLLEIANGMEADHAGRLQIGAINAQFLSAGGNVQDYMAAVRAAIDRDYITIHQSGAYLSFTQAGADLFVLSPVPLPCRTGADRAKRSDVSFRPARSAAT